MKRPQKLIRISYLDIIIYLVYSKLQGKYKEAKDTLKDKVLVFEQIRNPIDVDALKCYGNIHHYILGNINEAEKVLR